MKVIPTVVTEVRKIVKTSLPPIYSGALIITFLDMDLNIMEIMLDF